MSECDELILRVCQQPSEDFPRLLFADWCDGNGETERAEFIRLQIEIASMLAGIKPIHHNSLDMILDPDSAEDQEWKHAVWDLQQRERELLDFYGCLWFAGFLRAVGIYGIGVHLERNAWQFRPAIREEISWCEFRRGCVDLVTCTARQWLAHGPTIVQQQPITRVVLSDAEPFPPADVQSKRALLWARTEAGLEVAS